MNIEQGYCASSSFTAGAGEGKWEAAGHNTSRA
jgi:hypothetical protein